MKVAVFQDDRNILTFYNAEAMGMNKDHPEFRGYSDLPIEKPKKVVTKEIGAERGGAGINYQIFKSIGHVESGATNFRLLYDIEE